MICGVQSSEAVSECVSIVDGLWEQVRNLNEVAGLETPRLTPPSVLPPPPVLQHSTDTTASKSIALDADAEAAKVESHPKHRPELVVVPDYLDSQLELIREGSLRLCAFRCMLRRSLRNMRNCKRR